MAFPLASLPQEIVGRYVVRHLAAEDVVSLIQCVDFPVNETLYHHCYPDDPHFAHYDAKMFRERALARLYLIKNPEKNTRTGNSRKRIHRPAKKMYNMVDLNETVVQAAPQSNGAYIVTARGELYGPEQNIYSMRSECFRAAPIQCDHLPDNKDDYDEQQYEFMKSEMERKKNAKEVDNGRHGWDSYEEYATYDLYPPSGVVELSDKFFAKPRAPPHFVQVCMGDCILALDEDGIPWTDSGGDRMVPFCIASQHDKSAIAEKIIKVGYMEGCMFFTVEGKRLLSCRMTDEYEQLETGIDPDGYRSGYPCSSGHLCYVYVSPETTETSDSFYMFSKVLVYLTNDGILKASYTGEDDPDECYNYGLIEKIGGANKAGPFATMAVSGKWIFLTTRDGRVVCVDTEEAGEGGETGFNEGFEEDFEDDYEDESDDEVKEDKHSEEIVPRLVKGLEDLKIVSMVTGSGRCLLLTEDRDVYWFSSKLDSGQVRDDTVVVVPERLELPGKAFRLFGDTGSAGVLVYK